MLWSNVKKILWLGFVFALLLLAARSYETWWFLDKAVKTEAVIVKTAAAPDQQTQLAFITANNTAIKFHTELPASVINESVMQVLYNPLIPSQAKIENLYIIWSGSIWVGISLMVLLLSIIITELLCKRYQKKCKKILQSGNHIYTKYLCVEALVGHAKDAAKGYQIVTAWRDSSGKEHQFKSEKLSFNPMEYILDQTIKVMIDKKNKKRYIMDLSFLPKEIQAKQ